MPTTQPTPAAGAIVLAPMPTSAECTYHHDGDFTVGDPFGDKSSYNRYADRRAWDHWHPSRWYEFFARLDAQGRRWTACGGVFVTDDFGALVPVPRGLQ